MVELLQVAQLVHDDVVTKARRQKQQLIAEVKVLK